MKPVVVGERIQLLDIARGLAILGILLINMRFFTTSLQAIQFQIELWPGFWDRTVKSFLDLFVGGKFIAIFSFLFGYGMILFKDRAVQKGRRFTVLYSRRLLALLVFGIIHGWFIWFGDILLHYALLGFALLLFHKCKPKTLLIWSLLLLMLVPGLLMIGGGVDTPELSPEWREWVQQRIERDQTIYGSGSWTEIHNQRIMDWNNSLMNQVLFYPQILGLFLLGAYFSKKRIFHELSANRASLMRICLWTGGFGLVTTVILLILERIGVQAPGLINRLEIIHHLLGSPMIGLFYVSVLALFVSVKAWQRALRPLANAGRMAFTNYIMQSVVCTLIFYSYGLGWYGQAGPAAASLLALAIFALQLVLSSLWFRRFRMGPLEWLWRSITYLSFSPGKQTHKQAADKSRGIGRER